MKKHYLSLLAAVLLSAGVNAQLNVFDDAYAPGVSFVPFGSTNNNLSVSTAEKYTGTSSLQITLAGSGNYSGGRLETPTGNNLSSYNALTFWVKASKAATVNLLGFGNSNGGNNFTASIANIAVNTTWKQVIVPIPDANKLSAERGLFQFSEGQDEGAYSIFVDDIKFENIAGIGTPSLSIPNETFEGFIGEAVTNSTAIANVVYPVNAVNVTMTIGRRYLDFTAADPSIVATSAGGSVLTPSAEGSTTVTATLNGQSVPGAITFSVYPATPGPAQPTVPQSMVQSLYSNAYTNLPVTSWSSNTSRATVRDVVLTGNDLKRYFFVGTTGTNYSQTPFTAIDVSPRTHLHMDVYTNTSTVLQVKLVNGAAQEFNYNLVTNLGGLPLKTWKSFDIPLSAFSSMGLTNVNQMLITASAGSTVYIDNVVFTSTVPLPVTISQFTATRNNNSTQLTWTTSTEINNGGFAVERSGDNIGWQQIDFVASNASAGNYSVVDRLPVSGNNYYRLKQVDKDGQFTYSNTLLVKYKGKIAAIGFYPNPVKNQMMIQVGSLEDNSATIKILSVKGEVLRTKSLSLAHANSTFTLDINGVAKGIYILQLKDGMQTFTQKFIKE